MSFGYSNRYCFSRTFQKTIDGSIVFDKVSLVYPESGIKALNDISFSIKAGEVVTIVGPTGSGKKVRW